MLPVGGRFYPGGRMPALYGRPEARRYIFKQALSRPADGAESDPARRAHIPMI